MRALISEWIEYGGPSQQTQKVTIVTPVSFLNRILLFGSNSYGTDSDLKVMLELSEKESDPALLESIICGRYLVQNGKDASDV